MVSELQFNYSHAVTGNDVRQRLADAPVACAEDEICSFKDLVDIINPLQQLPIVSSLYRDATGDTISAGSRMAGGFLFGGPIGFAVAAVNAGLDLFTGGDVGEHLLAFLKDSQAERQYAAAAYQKASALG